MTEYNVPSLLRPNINMRSLSFYRSLYISLAYEKENLFEQARASLDHFLYSCDVIV